MYKNILVIRISSLGDVLLTTPVIRALKTNYPEAKIDVLTYQNYGEVFENNPYINNILLLKKNTDKDFDIFSLLKNKSYNLVLDLQNNIRSRKITKLVNSNIVRFPKFPIRKFLLVNFKLNLMKNFPQIPERYASALPELLLDENGLDFFYFEKSMNKANNKISICPGAKHYTKQWPAAYYQELIKRLIKNGFIITLIGGLDDNQIIKKINSEFDYKLPSITKNSLKEIAEEIQKCKIVIGHDSGLMHLATAIKIPVVVFYGSTVREFGFFPYKNKNLILENNSLSCRPCSHIGRDKCPKGHFKCMNDLTPDMAYNKIIDFIQEC